MIFLQSIPDASLQDYIYQYWYLQSDDPSEFGHLKQMMFPMDYPGLALYFMQKPTIQHLKNKINKKTEALFTGLITSPGSITFQADKPIEGFVIAFLPHGFSDIFKINAAEVTDKLPDFFSLNETEGKQLYTAIQQAKDFEAKIKIADDYFLQKLPGTNHTCQMIEAVHKIVNSDGLIDVENLAKEVNMSISTLERHFKKRVGVSAKMYARFKRFHHALALLNEPESKSWLQIAHECGYFDQAHFIKEFHKFTNQKPSAFSPMDYPLFSRFIIQKS